MNITTIKELDEWMTTNCYNNKYAIGNRNIDEGCGLDTFGSLFIWYYTERGERGILNYFQTEKEAVDYAFKVITADKMANSHLVGFVNNKESEAILISELQKRNTHFWKDEILSNGLKNMITRIFVNGCDIKDVLDLQMKYGFKNKNG